ncbi:unnamed protein product, partial [Rotaria sp. Silwood2]
MPPAVIVGCVWIGTIDFIGIVLRCVATFYYDKLSRSRGRALYSNNAYINGGTVMEYDISNSVFISATFASYYYQYDKYNGPFNMKLEFYPTADYVVHGGGIDDVGAYVITGIYSPRTLRMSLEKQYQAGTGNPKLNLGHKVTIQVEWNQNNLQFEGKYYFQNKQYYDENKFIIRYEGAIDDNSYSINSAIW